MAGLKPLHRPLVREPHFSGPDHRMEPQLGGRSSFLETHCGVYSQVTVIPTSHV